MKSLSYFLSAAYGNLDTSINEEKIYYIIFGNHENKIHLMINLFTFGSHENVILDTVINKIS